jgi:hypothetical protein
MSETTLVASYTVISARMQELEMELRDYEQRLYAHFLPLAQAVTTEEEAMTLLARIPLSQANFRIRCHLLDRNLIYKEPE